MTRLEHSRAAGALIAQAMRFERRARKAQGAERLRLQGLALISRGSAWLQFAEADDA